MNEKTLKLRQINNLLAFRDKNQKCPIDGSRFTSECLFCETCDKFKNYIKNEFNVDIQNGRFIYGTSKSGKWTRTQETINKTKKTKNKIKQNRIDKIIEVISRQTGHFDSTSLSKQINESEGFIITVLRDLKKQGKIKRKVINRYEYKYIKVQETTK